MSDAENWRFWIDRGGTFTDIVATDPSGRLRALKLLSENPGQYSDAASAGIERLLSENDAGDASIEHVKMGTTVGTNALLERQGVATVLVITEGLADLLRIGSQQRPDIFSLDIRLPEMLYSETIEACERMSADGGVVIALDEARLARDLEAAKRRGIESVAIALLHAYRAPQHEHIAARIARDAGFSHVSISSEISPAIKLVDRGDTTVVDAYLTPVLNRYVNQLSEGFADKLERERLLFMQSHGGLVEADAFRGCDSVLSGPAGGVVGMAMTARDAGCEEVIGFDMGGTSTDVSVYAGRYERTASALIGGSRIARPMLRINTVAAGGGSKLAFRGGRLQVGPASAGAQPGPACYRNGGPLTLTDANVLLGRIQPDWFPAVFGPEANEPIDTDIVAERFATLSRDIAAEGGGKLTSAELAEGFLRIAIANMAQAIEQISVRRGHDVTRFALSCFGGAGGQHACRVADALGIETVLVDPLSGVLSAYGIGVAERRSIQAASVQAQLDEGAVVRAEALRQVLVAGLGSAMSDIDRFESRAYLRVAGSDTSLAVSFAPGTTAAAMVADFAAQHQRRFGFAGETRALVLDKLEVEAIAASHRPARSHAPGASGAIEPIAERRVWFSGQWQDTPVYARAALGAGDAITGPAIVVEENATIVIEPEWRAAMNGTGVLVLHRTKPRARKESIATQADPIMLEIFNNQFMHVAEQMGVVLEQTAYSVNIKERLDYSCAIFDRDGELIANAPHVPVHLGSMGDSVRQVIRSQSALAPDDAYCLNAPYQGGTHLPDITVVTPIFERDNQSPSFFVASRAHHADIGGITPGSMPALSHTIEQEGVVIECMRIVRGGRFLEDEIRSVLASGPYPARNPGQNLADLKAQLAANAMGAAALDRLLTRYGGRVIHAYMAHVRRNAEECARRALRRLDNGRFTAALDTGARISVDVVIDREQGSATIDFAGTDRMVSGNLNAPRSIVHAVALYVLRCLIEEDIPLNAGCLVPLDIRIPPQSLLDPHYPAAVAGGNVETSQCIADVLLAALGAAAASQGTMNNFTFGDADHQYYETICGGCGAGPGFDGASAVHSHMTNSRLTDVEVLELRFPVRVVRFAIRSGSGGPGRWRGGDGVCREIEFLAPMEASLLTNRRHIAPFGLAGGSDGAPGYNTIVRGDGRREILPAAAEMSLRQGDRVLIETPGGGGYGRESDR
jgi:5-oxoprolinase (ATP-hydrolysing)